MKCDKCGKILKPGEEHFIGGDSRRIYIGTKPSFYCQPCYKEHWQKQWIAILIGGIIALLVIAFWAYVIPKLFRTKKKRPRR